MNDVDLQYEQGSTDGVRLLIVTSKIRLASSLLMRRVGEKRLRERLKRDKGGL
jgi:hypothetical protein